MANINETQYSELLSNQEFINVAKLINTLFIQNKIADEKTNEEIFDLCRSEKFFVLFPDTQLMALIETVRNEVIS